MPSHRINQAHTIDDENEALKRMHKQAHINIRHPTVLKTTLRRRVGQGQLGGFGNTTDPLEQYKPLKLISGGNLSNQIVIPPKLIVNQGEQRYLVHKDGMVSQRQPGI